MQDNNLITEVVHKTPFQFTARLIYKEQVSPIILFLI